MLTCVNSGDLGASLLDEQEVNAVSEVIKSGRMFGYGDASRKSQCQLLEEAITGITRSAGAVAVANGTVALRAALQIAGIKPGSRVYVSAYTFIATASVVIGLGAEPIPVESTLRGGISVSDLERKWTLYGEGPVIPVHLPGRAAPMEDLAGFSRRTGAIIVEDACQAFGARDGDDDIAGTRGRFGAYSLHQTKQIACGEGGIVVARNKDDYLKVRSYSDQGACRLGVNPTWEPDESMLGENLRMSEIQAAVARVQLAKLPTMIARQVTARDHLTDRIHATISPVKSGFPNGDTGASLLLWATSREAANEAIEFAASRGVLIKRPWPYPFYLNPAFVRRAETRRLRGVRCQESEMIADCLLNVPITPTLTEADLDIISSVLLGISVNFRSPF